MPEKEELKLPHVVSMRFEYFGDLLDFLRLMERALCGTKGEYKAEFAFERNHHVISEPVLEIRSVSPVHQVVLETLRTLPDSHVAIQTLRELPMSENTTERDFTKE